MNAPLRLLLLLSAAGSVLGVLLILARRLTGIRLPSSFWYYAWLPVLLRLALPLPGLVPTQRTSTPLPLSPTAIVQPETEGPRAYRYEGEKETPIGYGESAAEEDETAKPGHLPEEDREPSPAEPAGSSFWSRAGDLLRAPEFWLALWFIGAVICIARYVVGYVRFRHLLMGTLRTTDGSIARVYASFDLRRKPKLFASSCVKTPMLLGLLRPLIVLPEQAFSPEAARNILRHELTHFRRGDIFFKWFAVLVTSLHWFNPIMGLFRREIDRTCELSCDEQILSQMDMDERKSYGETLLTLASNRTLPAGVVATTFATEKRTLKERLIQIMKSRFKPRAILALTIAALLLMGTVALAAGPARASAASADSSEPMPVPANNSELASDELSTASVSDVDELLAAIAPDTQILLEPGTYDLSMASDYGKDTDSDYYRWEEVYDGYELVIENVTALHIVGTAENTIISAIPRYADVLAFEDCQSVKLSGITLGHTKEQGVCAGGVIHLMGTNDAAVSGCALYGCGILGVEAENCQNIFVKDSDIYECSNGAVWLTSCRSVQFDGCDFRDCFNHYGEGAPAFQVFNIANCYGVAITDGHVYGNYATEFVNVSYSQEVYLLGTLFEDNTVDTEMFWHSGTILSVEGEPITVAGCEFRDDFPIYAASETSPAADLNGNALSNDGLAAMKQTHVDFPGFAEMETPELERTQDADGTWEVHVSTVDEFLAAIAPDTTVYLDEGLYDLSEAANYGAYGSPYYYWGDLYDGPGLVISGVENFSIVGADKDTTRIEALPRYADVIRFDNCKNISVHGVTAGHTLGAGSCSGAVLDFTYCEGVDVRDCGLFGCGTYGVVTMESTDITVKDNEIYECSYGAVELSRCVNAVFANNNIHDCAYPTYAIYECLDVTIDNEAVEAVMLDTLDPDITSYTLQEARDSGSQVLQEIVERGTVIFDADIDVPGAGPYKSANMN